MSERHSVLVVEDDDALRELLVEELGSEGHRVESVGRVDEARSALKRTPADLVVSDLRLPGEHGTKLLEWTRDRMQPAPAFIIVTAFGSVRQAVDALRAGADDFLTKPLDLDHLRVAAGRALENRALRVEVDRYRKALSGDDFHGMVGRSPIMTELFRDIRRVARGVGPVLIRGESGTGKELVARAIHAESSRSDRPFLAVNCAGIPSDLLESEFFGHAEGAFTGATSGRKGLFLEADGGTILLDEIGEMPTELQVKLLRVLQEGRVRPVGSDRELSVDVRVLAASNQDLETAMDEDRFRRDLYYRLETFQLVVPPLRERGDDLERLAGHFLRRTSARIGVEAKPFSSAALARLRSYPFPGNVRELENTVERAVTFCDGEKIRPEHFPERVRRGMAGSGKEAPARSDASAGLVGPEELPSLDEVERRYILHVLDRVEGNKRRAAALLGIGRRTLYRRLEEYDVDSRE